MTSEKYEHTTTIVLYGELDEKDGQGWLNWLEYAQNLSGRLGFPANYVGVRGETFKSGKVLTLKRTVKRIQKAVENNEQIQNISFYSLPDDFGTAIFDYDVYLSRCSDYAQVLVTMSSERYARIDSQEVIDELKQHIRFSSGEVFTMSRRDVPSLYAAKLNPPGTHKSVQVIDRMYNSDLVNRLYACRKLRTELEIADFEETVESLLSLGGDNLTRDLLVGFDDETEHTDVMFGLVHAVESLDRIVGTEKALTDLAEAMPSILPHAKKWAILLHKRIANHAPSLEVYQKIVSQLDHTTNTVVSALFEEVQ
ncbi:hypothetical protein CBW65_07440 [Tumebacillus avium]|uniref:Immunity protein 30 domain-containing protein n=1 Tax=Tumebacillus avium TaxID=1903704 RepID=A0A1Y0INN9_9BACL|nr:Imm30 family immunity protein [Tumebacillus avium]ARU60934.1 hypothetical protein CBW65_07440 [Tumebacillus avium]